jgi:hypothetical protein
VEPGVEEHVHVGFIKAAGGASTTVMPAANDGPLLVAVMVYVIGRPERAGPVGPDFVSTMSAVGTSGSVSVWVLSSGVRSRVPTGTEMAAVFEIDPVAVLGTTPVTTYVIVPPGPTFTVSFIFTEPLAVHNDPTEAVHVHVIPVSVLGTISVTVAPIAEDGPELDTVIV